MRLSGVTTMALAIAPMAVSAKGRMGYCLGVRRADGSCKTQQDFVDDFTILKATPLGVKYVRTYAGIDGGANSLGKESCKVPGNLLPAAKSAGVQVVLGLWADTESAFQADMDETLKYASEYSDSIYAFTVGSEGLYREEQKKGTGYSAEDLLTRIDKLKKALGDAKIDKKVGTADSWNKFQDGSADLLITGGVNLFLVNAFGYWQSQDISNATATYLDDLQQAYGHIQSVAKSTTSIELWNGETGWPSDGGSNYDNGKGRGIAIASTENAQTFFSEGVCAALDWDFDVFYFEAFAEPWKPASTGLDGQAGDETHWGAFDKDRKPVIKDLSCKN